MEYMLHYELINRWQRVSLQTQISYVTSQCNCLCFPGACMVLTHSQCQILPYHSTMAPLLPIIKTMDMEKFLKFFMYLHRLSCYQHILLFGCSLAFPECIIDGDDRYFGAKSFNFKSPVILGTNVQEEQIVLLLSFISAAFRGREDPHLS